ncbi:hypothetical protein [Lysinibacillus piscis]|uniref:Uncharacterized protein n=1 Tax=Lysinibacillus piscis TaxID=2518931 RepID=A0ABQ5NGY9_9BACI|nr:hypothetical protein [Lysinibacillus sp. KH24]GLC87601.1 hypothetical protein LYSBPC_07280 [Lysinibacillus sp. KH24]
MRPTVKIISKVEVEKQYERILQLELDYELASLFFAMNEKNEAEIAKCKARLAEIQMELESLHAYV